MTGRAKQLFVLAVLMTVGGWFLSRPAPPIGNEPSNTMAPVPETKETIAEQSLVHAGPGRARPARAALPPVDAPLAAILGPLAARADAGDSRAACRLAMELLRCSTIGRFGPVAGLSDTSAELELEAKGNLDAADNIALAELERLRQIGECGTVPDALKDRGAKYLAQAARAGEPEAMIRYADVQHWPMDGRGVYADPEFDRWRRDAFAMLQRAFAAGVPEAPFYLMIGYQGDMGTLSTLVPNDPVKAEAIRLLMVRLHGWPDRLVPSTLDAKIREPAARLARQWHEGPFKGRSYRGQDRATFQFVGEPKRGGAPHEFCTADRLAP